jgi:hypothetical protein
MAGQVVQVVGLEALQASLSRLARALPDVAPEQAAAVIGARARSGAPKRSGRLASSWAPSASAGEVQLRFGAVYAGAVHFGTGPRVGLRGPHNIRPNPFLTRAIDDTRAQWVDKYQNDIEDLLDRVRGA